tara:strand:- start:268 stop:501 length:234 start_codon:yes stop_codon:yes gene_type:complete
MKKSELIKIIKESIKEIERDTPMRDPGALNCSPSIRISCPSSSDCTSTLTGVDDAGNCKYSDCCANKGGKRSLPIRR